MLENSSFVTNSIAMPLPSSLETVFATAQTPEALFEELLPQICAVLKVDRCFLEVRQPEERISRIFCWRQSDRFPDMTTDWQPEQPWENEDPLFAASLRTEPSIFVEDVETASPTVVNREFEAKYFGHRALVHAHIAQDGVLWGILQPCVFDHPRVWSESDRAIIDELTDRLLPWVMECSQAAEVSSGVR